MRGASVTLSVLGTGFDVTSDDPAMSELVELLWSPFVAPAGSIGAIPVAIEATEAGWSFRAPPDSGGMAADPWIFAALLRSFFSGRSIVSALSIVPLHGAAVERDGTVLVLSGPARSGKTTLLAALLEAGWTYVTDDLIPIDQETVTAAPFPKPLSFRDPGLWRRFASLWTIPAWLPDPVEVGLVPATAFPASASETYVPDVLVFPTYAPGAAPELEALSPAAAVARAADNLHVPSTRPATLKCLARLGNSASPYAVRYGDTADALELLERCLAARGTME